VVNKHVKEIGDGVGLLPHEDILLGPLDLASADLLPGRPLAPTGSALGASTGGAAQAVGTSRSTVTSPGGLEDFLLVALFNVQLYSVVNLQT